MEVKQFGSKPRVLYLKSEWIISVYSLCNSSTCMNAASDVELNTFADISGVESKDFWQTPHSAFIVLCSEVQELVFTPSIEIRSVTQIS
jgi:hypothetical protein